MIVAVFSWDNHNRPINYSLYKDKVLIRRNDLWKIGSKKKIIEIIKEQSILNKILSSVNEFVIVNYKKYLDYFKCGFNDVYDYPGAVEYDKHDEFVNSNWDEFGKNWQKLRGNAAKVYYKLEKCGVMLEYKNMFPVYDMNVFSGRSSTTGFNIQGCNKEFNIKHVNSSNNIFVHFDWMAADIRIAAILSGDKDLIDSYLKSDPYSHIVNILDGSVDRDQCKSEFMQAIYGLNPDHEILAVFPTCKKWISDMVIELNNNGFVRSILGRKYLTDGTIKGNRRAFNSIMQGSVAHAMNNVISKIDNKFENIILTEQHDSLTACVNEFNFQDTIKYISNIMLKPFEGILDGNITMPLRIHVGKHWRVYKQIKEVR